MAAQNPTTPTSPTKSKNLVISDEQAKYLEIGLPIRLDTPNGETYEVQSMHVIYGEFGLEHEMERLRSVLGFTRDSLKLMLENKLSPQELVRLDHLFDTMDRHIELPYHH